MDVKGFIATRRDGGRHTEGELQWFAKAAAAGDIPDYQITAWLMAAYLNPMDAQETALLTVAMAESGQRLDLTGLPRPWVDKHSTGGVGDKTTLVLLPLLAACGLTCVKMSGRGLGITGGTIDKLASVPGFRTDLSPEEMKRQAGEIGLALTGQTPDLAPADKVLYALRDATATVSSTPLIVSSILSKKIAGGAEALVLDVKCGSGAFMKTLAEAEALAGNLARTAQLAGLPTHLAITDMDQPLGRYVGNALEVREALSTLRGEAGRFRELCLTLAGLTLLAAGKAQSLEAGRATAEQVLDSGGALEKAKAWFRAQGAKEEVVETLGGLPIAPVIKSLDYAGEPAYCTRVDARTVGQAVVDLGGGRKRKDDTIDPAVGVVVLVEVGQKLEPGVPLFQVHAGSEEDAEAALAALRGAVEVGEEVKPNPLIHRIMHPGS